ncbi:MAG TPA: AAA family ATPase [Solirubrobacteraceae bacterium]|nr:AAA family ATPase [Solirubrobacteraceae bacterium]
MRTDPAERERDEVAADTVDMERYVARLRRNAVLIATIVIVLTAAVTVASLRVPKSYEATADVVILERDLLASTSSDDDSLRRRLATLRALVTTPGVLAPAAERLGIGTEALESRVSASADREAAVLSISASAGTARDAQQTANTVARSFVEQQTQAERTRLRAVIDRLSARIAQLGAAADPDAPSLRALAERRAELELAEAAADSDLEVARPADLPQAASAPRPLRNAVLALFASLFLGVLVALAREQLRPRPTARELSDVLGMPILVRLPENARRIDRVGRPHADPEAPYRSLAALLRVALPPGSCHSVLATSALRGEGKTTIVQRLGAVLAAAGQRTLVVSADLRSPDLDALYGVQDAPGLWDLLVGRGSTDGTTIEQVIVARADGEVGRPDVLPSGASGIDPGYTLQPRAIRSVLSTVADLDYAYVLIDGPPALGDGADAAVLATASDRILVVARLRRISTLDALELRERLGFIGARPLGLAVLDPDAAVSSPSAPQRAAAGRQGSGAASPR